MKSIIALFTITPTVTTILVFKAAGSMGVILPLYWIGICCGISLLLLFSIFWAIGKGIKAKGECE